MVGLLVISLFLHLFKKYLLSACFVPHVVGSKHPESNVNLWEY